jgi:uncharacterized protein YndB with AHSA1/START domain
MTAPKPASLSLARPDPHLELRSQRVVHAPQELVFRAMTEVDHLQRWWGPAGFTTSTEEFDPRPGGQWRFTMRAPDGRLFRNRVVFDAIESPSRIVYRQVPEPGADPVSFEVTVELGAQRNETAVSMTFRFATAELRRRIVETSQAERGNRETLNRLEAHLHSTRHPTAVVIDPDAPEFRTVRDLSAPVARVWDALTKPEQVARWWGGIGEAGRTEVPRFELEVGGAWSCIERTASGEALVFGGTFREISPPSRLVFTHRCAVEGFEGGEALVSVDLQEHDGGTRLSMTWGFSSMAGRQPWIDTGFQVGVGVHFDRLADHLANEWGGA